MPELPEVETVRAGLNRLIIKKTIAKVEVFDSPRSFPNPDADVANFMVGAQVVAVRRRAKVLLIDLSSDYSLMVHLKMTGQLVYVGSERFGAGHPNDSLLGELPDRSTRVGVEFQDGTHLYFNDQRRFGWMKLIPTVEVENDLFMRRVGPEPFDEAFTEQEFVKRIRRRNGTTVKAAILDQTTLAGVGNIYADESLWDSCIHPATRVRDLSDEQLMKLFRSIKAVLKLSIENGGSTNRNYVNAEGGRGHYMDFAKVFRREGKPCLRHAEVLIEKIRVAGRGTHICSVCQVKVGD